MSQTGKNLEYFNDTFIVLVVIDDKFNWHKNNWHDNCNCVTAHKQLSLFIKAESLLNITTYTNALTHSTYNINRFMLLFKLNVHILQVL